jgi:outer membrane protein OmpA-like peptidoglycan-associated protein
MKQAFSTIAIILLLVMTSWSQESSSFIPQNVGPGINSTYDEFNPVLSPDGNTLYFVRANHPENKYGEFDSQDIWYSEFVNGAWAPAQRIPDLNIGRYNAILSITDDYTLLLNGIYNKNGTFWKKRGLSTSIKLPNGEWAIPVPLRVKKVKKKNDGRSGGAFMSSDGSAILFSYHKFFNSNKSDIFVSLKKENGNWTRPKKEHLLSSSYTEFAPFLSADNKTVYLTSDDLTKGQFHIFKAKRQGESWHDWSQPTHLSDTINTPGWDGYFKTNKIGSWAYYSSSEKSVGGSDIFKVKLFEENPFVIVYGTVVNGKTGKPVQKPFFINVNGRQADSVSVNLDSGTYKMKLPLRKKYEAIALIDHYTSLPAVIDVSTVKELSTLKKDLIVNPIEYVHVKGKVLNRSTLEPIPSSANVKILVDNAEFDSLKFDSQSSTYSMNINHGKKYSLITKGDKFESTTAALDLSAVDEFQEINFDLFLETVKLVTVSGLILDKKTSKGFKPAAKIQVTFSGPTTVAASIDTVTSRYEIHLQPGSNYNISTSAPNCVPVYDVINLVSASRGSALTKDLVLATIEVGQAVRLNNIFFESGKAVLKKESFPELDRVHDFLTQNAAITIEISGHTDNVGNAAFNLGLSKSRAEAVMNYIIKKGIAKDRMQAKGYGMTKPVASNATKEGKAQNRRVEFTILGK